MSQAFINGDSTATGGTVDVSATTVNTADTTVESTGRGAGLNSAIKNLLEGTVDPSYLDKALKSNPVTTSPALTAVSGGLPISVAGAVALTKFTPTTQAFVDSSTVTAKHTININSSADNNATTDADASTTTANADNSVGVAVAINDTVASNSAMVESTTGTASLSADVINVAATAPTASDDDVHDDSASATSGVSAENVGVAGGLALNIVSNTTEATVPSGSTVSTVGDVAFNAQDSVTETATAQPPDGEVGGDAEGALGSGRRGRAEHRQQHHAGQADGHGATDRCPRSVIHRRLRRHRQHQRRLRLIRRVGVDKPLGGHLGRDKHDPGRSGSASTPRTTRSQSAAHSPPPRPTPARQPRRPAPTAGDGDDFSAGVSIALGFVTDLTTATTARRINAQGRWHHVRVRWLGGKPRLLERECRRRILRRLFRLRRRSELPAASYADSMGKLTDSKGNPVSAGNTKSDAATPSAQTSDGSVTVAAAVAVNIVDSESDRDNPRRPVNHRRRPLDRERQ